MGEGGKGGKGQYRMRLLAAIALLLAAPAWAQESVTLYTSLHEQNLPLFIAAFEKKHGIKVNAWRSGADKVLLRTVTEAGAGRHDVDVVLAGSGELEALHREKLLAPINSPSHENLALFPNLLLGRSSPPELKHNG